MNLNTITKYRSVWMAFAIVWVIIFHSAIIIPNSIISFIKQLGYGGVDIFIFASGLGCYYSLSKNSDINEFLKRRAKKLLPTFWCILIAFFAYKKLTTGISIPAIIGNILCIQTFTFRGNSFNWYICGIWLFYFLAPYIYFHTNKIKTKFSALTYLLFLVLFTIPFFKSDKLIIMVTRLPLFFMGMYCAKLSMDKKYKLSKISVILSIIAMIVGFISLKYCFVNYTKYLTSYGLYWYPFILIVPGLCLCISKLCELIDNKKIGKQVIRFLNFVGNNTFELYLTHSLFFTIIKKMIRDRKLDNSNFLWIKCIGLVIIFSILLKYITKFVTFVATKIYNSYKSRKLAS